MTVQKSKLSWADVKTQLAAFDRAGLLGLVQDLYAANKDNQAFLHTRLHLGGDVLKPYKATIARWLWPDVFKNQDSSVAKAKKAIADYRQASGTAEGLAELMVFYCEQAAGFSASVALDDEGYLGALVRMFGQALAGIATLPPENRSALRARLDAVRSACDGMGYGVGGDMDELLAGHLADQVAPGAP